MSENTKKTYTLEELSSMEDLTADVLIELSTISMLEFFNSSALNLKQKSQIADFLISQRLEVDPTENLAEVDRQIQDYLNLNEVDKCSYRTMSTLTSNLLLQLVDNPELPGNVIKTIVFELKSRISYSNEERNIRNRKYTTKTNTENRATINSFTSQNSDYRPYVGHTKFQDYPALSIISTVLKVIGYIILVGGIIYSLYLLTKDVRYNFWISNFRPALISLVSTLFSSILLLAQAELIIVLVDISSYARNIYSKMK